MRFDEGRQADLKMIEDKLAGTISKHGREALTKARTHIIATKNDPLLNDLRKRLFRARRAGDGKAGDKIEEQIRALELNHKV